MEKSARYSVAWHASTAGYRISKQTDQGTITAPVNDESTAWNEWLEFVSSFAFQGRDGHHLTVLKERRGHQRTYWTAYRSIGGKLRRKYLGVSTRVTLAQLEQVSAALTESTLATTSATGKRDQDRMPWQDSLVSTKFRVPTPSHALISRPRLVALLNQGLQHPLILVTAPAGFGKTTLVSTWIRSLHHDQIQVAWVSLDRGDNDPVRFWTTVLTALEQGDHDCFHQILEILHVRPSPPLEHVLTMLINRLSDTAHPRLLLLDNYQVVSDSSVHNQLSYLVEYQPSDAHLLLLSRNDPPLSLARLRARGQIQEVLEDQLRATVEETRLFLTEVMEVRPPDEIIEELARRIEGWWVGLHLVGLSLQRCTDPADMLAEVRGSQRYIMDYLVGEVLWQQPATVQRFLLHTCILKQLCAPLCNVVVGEPGSQQRLVELEHANVFVVPLDEHRQWYRYHTLFAEALRYQLELQYADEIDTLHVRASVWYAEQGNTFEAVHHALQAHAWQMAADLVEQVPHWLMWNERQNLAGQLRQCLSQLPKDTMLAYPQLYLIYAQALYFVVPHATVESGLQAAEAALAAPPSQTNEASASHKAQENLLGEIAAFQAVLAIYQCGDAQTGKEALTRLMPLLKHATQQKQWSHVLELLLLQTRTHNLLGEEQDALNLLSYVVHLAEPEGHVRLFADEGPQIEMLLRRLWEQERKHGPTPYLDTLLAAFSAHEQTEQLSTQSQQPELFDQLSAREMEVLQQLSRGASNREIAEELVITIETVKRHMGKILRKLQVNNRTQAVVQARMLGLLTEEAL